MIADTMLRDNKLALLLSAEVSNVITSMRQKQNWALVAGRYNEEDHMEPDPMYEEFRALRRKIFPDTGPVEDWTQVHPLEYLTPFLKVVRDPETSNVNTTVALTSLHRLLTQNVIAFNTVGAGQAVAVLVSETVQCKYQSTTPALDGVVDFNILQVLLEAVRCDAGVLLEDEAVSKAFQAAFLLGNGRDLRKDQDNVLLFYSRQVMGDIISTIFRRLNLLGTHEPTDLDGAGIPFSAYCHGERVCAEVLHFCIDLVSEKEEALPGGAPDAPQSGQLVMFGLQMIHRAVLVGGPVLAKFPGILDLLQRHLFPALVEALKDAGLGVISGTCQLLLTLFQVLGNVLMLQLESFIKNVILRLADGKGATKEMLPEQQEAALEGLLDLCRQDSFVHRAFVNCDCRLERANLFEDLCSLLSKTAFPVGHTHIGPLHLTSLEALLAILQALSLSNGECLKLPPMVELEEVLDVWGPITAGEQIPLQPLVDKVVGPSDGGPGGDGGMAAAASSPELIPLLRSAGVEKLLKLKVALATDHFNRDYKKGFQYLQANKLLPELMRAEGTEDAPKDSAVGVNDTELARCIGAFLRSCPGLNKTVKGDLLGEYGDFYSKVLSAYTDTFDFHDVSFDAALRMYLGSFRLPGESQKIDRIMMSFGRQYYKHNSDLFHDADAAYVLAFSVIMLNTDMYNTQVKKKMDMDGFKRNVRGTNGGADFPPDFLTALYNSIASNEIKLNDTAAFSVSDATWINLAQQAMTNRGKVLPCGPANGMFDSYMFHLMWGPAVHAISVVLEFADTPATVELALQGLQLAAKIACHYDVDGVVDNIVVALCKFTQPISQPNMRPAVALGQDLRASMVMQALFKIVNRYADCLRGSWCNVMDVVVRLHKLDLLPDSLRLLIEADEGGPGTTATAGTTGKEGEEGGKPMPRSASKRRINATSRSQQQNSGGFFRTWMPGMDGGASTAGQASSQAELDAQTRALQLIENCHIEEVFADSKFLRAESLKSLVSAIIWAAGPPPRQSSTPSPDTEVAEICLDLLLTVLLRNRDRIALQWDDVLKHLHSITSERGVASALVERAVTGLLRLCQRLLPYKSEVAEPLLKGLQLIQRLDAESAWELAEKMAVELLALIKGAAQHIQFDWAWHSVCGLLQVVAVNPFAFPTALEALRWCCEEGGLGPMNFIQVLNATTAFVDRSGNEHPMMLPNSLRLLELQVAWLEGWADKMQAPDLDPSVVAWWTSVNPQLWYHLVSKLCVLVCHPLWDIRSVASSLLQRVVIGAERMAIPGVCWERALNEHLVPRTKEIVGLMRNRNYAMAEQTARDMVKMLSKVVLLYLPVLAPLPSFGPFWRDILDTLAAATATGAETLVESAPEALKNMLLVMHAKGVLREGWTDSEGADLWDLTWRRSRGISTNLTPKMLLASGAGQAQATHPTIQASPIGTS